jgi:hypothetical protein
MFLLRRLCPGEAGGGFHSSKGPLAGIMSSIAGATPNSETQESFGRYGRVSGGSLNL